MAQLNMLVLTGDRAAGIARTLQQHDPTLLVCTGAQREDTDAMFRNRLRLLLVAATSGRRTCLVEPQPLRLPAPARRMLERVALGYDVPVYGPRPWLQPFSGSVCSLPPPRPLDVVLNGYATAWSDPADCGPVPAGYGLGRWPQGYGKTLLIVGDKPSLKWPAGRPTWPFVSALRSGCSWWLGEQLERARVPESRLYWVDAADREGRVLDLPAQGNQLLFAGVFALGRNAADWCWNNGWIFNHVHHPQYWHRWQSGKQYQLTKLLTKLGEEK